MTIQEQQQNIRQGLAIRIMQYADNRAHNTAPVVCADTILAFLADSGVVIKTGEITEQVKGQRKRWALTAPLVEPATQPVEGEQANR